MDTYLKDLLDLPVAVNKGDFVLKLAEGVEKADETLRTYVVTEQLQGCFDESLSLIQNSLAGNSSKACYLHGSFGCGKSHFMAVLNLILGGNTQARSIPELAGVISKHNEWSQGKKFLMVPYHMIGKESMESAILGGYVEHISQKHPDADVPPVFTSDKIFEDAVKLRQDMGDDTFFAALNKNSQGGGGKWGKMSAQWNAASFDEAVSSAPEFDTNDTYQVTGKKPRLQSALVKEFFTSIVVNSPYVDLDKGLEVISQHAKSLGYDAVVLFLDELILWLASNAANQAFLSQEGQKISKLVEAEHMHRPIPLISFVARQRDLRELVGDHVSGSDKTRFTHVIDYWEGRFSKITLEDRNLPAIAEKRVLRPSSEGARQQIDAAFEKSTNMKDDVLKVLLTSTWDKGMFRKIYPFSPAFMEMLVEMSFMLQRDRTALKVMLQILIDRRDNLKLGEIIPVGDLFDAISQGDEAISEDVKRCFANATRLYEEKLCPLLEAEHNMTMVEMAKSPYDDPKAMSLRNDDRLIKTLLLAALAPKLESFQELTAQKLAALNHGTIKSPIPNRETVTVINKCKKWAGQVGQIKIGQDPQNPTVSVQLSGVDTESILLKAQHEDNVGNRIRKIKEILFQQFDIKRNDELVINHNVTWRGTKHTCEIVFGNVRDMSLSALENANEDWKIVIDWPFDEGYTPADDIAKVREFKSTISEGARTLVVLPSFLSATARKDLGMLVVLEHVLVETRFPGYASEFTPADQQVAKSLLQNQRSQLEQRLVTYLESAYGVGTPAKDALDTTHEFEDLSQHFWSLDNDLQLQPPAAPTLQRMFNDLVHQALNRQFPGHPLFPETVKLTKQALQKIYEEVQKASENPEGRQAVDKSHRRQMTDVAVPLKLGNMGEAHFVLSRYWVEHFTKKENENLGEVTVKYLRQWINEPRSMGLPKDVEDLIILCFAAQDNRSFWHMGVPVDPEVGRLTDDWELREVSLPSEDEWTRAKERVAKLFGLSIKSPLLNAHSLGKFVNTIKERVDTIQQPVIQYYEVLKGATGSLCPESNRLMTAESAKSLLATLLAAKTKDVVSKLLDWQNRSSDEAVGSNITRCNDLLDTVKGIDWSQLNLLDSLQGDYQTRACTLKETLRDALNVDEYVTPLAPVILDFKRDSTALLKEFMEQKQTTPSDPPEPPRTGKKRVSKNVSATELDSAFQEIRKFADDADGSQIRITWEIVE